MDCPNRLPSGQTRHGWRNHVGTERPTRTVSSQSQAARGAAHAPERLPLTLKEQKAATAWEAVFGARLKAARRWRATDMATATATAVWKYVRIDSLGFVLVVWSIPAAILVVGTPIVLFADF